MSKSHYVSKLGLKFSAVAAVALVFAFAVFLLLYEGITWWFLNAPEFDSYWEKEGTAAIESFQTYVSEKSLTVDEAIRDVSWEKAYRSTYLYFSNSPDEYASEDGTDTQPGIPIMCADGVIFAYAFPSPSHYDSIGMVASLGAAALCFFVILIPYVCHIIRRITHLSQEMEILAGGELDYHIESPGTDELAELGRSIEGMRLSVIEQMERENCAVLANSRLITSLSHDLRTPLTKLTGYLEILRYKRCRDADEEDRYLRLAIEKAEQIKQLSDEMFRTCLVVKEPTSEEKEASVSGSVLLAQILSEQCFDLQSAGFSAEPPVIEGDFALSTPTVTLRRIFDNLFSNVKKYADPSKPVVLAVDRQAKEVGILISNFIRENVEAESSGIGIPTVRQLAVENGGRMEISQTKERFFVRLFFPVHERT